MPESCADAKSSSSKKKLSSVLILALLSIAWVVSQVNQPTEFRSVHNSSKLSTKSTRKKKFKNSSAITKDDHEVTRTTLPIYLIEPATNKTAITTWGKISTQWDRTTQYIDLFNDAASAPSLPSLRKMNKRPVIIIHCGPKSGSTTLRAACRHNLEDTCGISIHAQKKRQPVGYEDPEKFFPLVQSCNNTHHFCSKNVSMPLDFPIFEDVGFIHLFPFRNYDEWAASALKQAYDRGKENGCNKAEALLKKCKPSEMEIDFRKYGKTDLSLFKESVLQRIGENKESHTFLLYFHRDMNDVISLVSNFYGLPLLPGSDGSKKGTRPEGTCDNELLENFHSCFSWKLMELK